MQLLSTRCDNPTFSEALDRTRVFLQTFSKSNVFFLNIDCLRQSDRDEEYRKCLSEASLVLPDGIGLKWVAKLFGHRLKANCNGTDFCPQLMRHAAKKGYKVFFLGGASGVGEKAAQRMTKILPTLQIAGVHDGYFDSDERVVERINASGADILLVAMGVPFQEKWIVRNRHRLNARLCLGVGALIDFWSGRVQRAPRMLRALKLEWFWRMCLEPKRLLRRYLVDDLSFFYQMLKRRLFEPVTARLG